MLNFLINFINLSINFLDIPWRQLLPTNSYSFIVSFPFLTYPLINVCYTDVCMTSKLCLERVIWNHFKSIVFIVQIDSKMLVRTTWRAGQKTGLWAPPPLFMVLRSMRPAFPVSGLGTTAERHGSERLGPQTQAFYQKSVTLLQ